MGEREYVRQNKQLLITSSQQRTPARVNTTKSFARTADSGNGTTTILSAYPVGSYSIYSFDGLVYSDVRNLA